MSSPMPQTMNEVISGTLADRRFSMICWMRLPPPRCCSRACGLYGAISYPGWTADSRARDQARSGRQTHRHLPARSNRWDEDGFAADWRSGPVAAYGLTRLIRRMFYGVSATDPATFAVIFLLLSGGSVPGLLVPARRATRVDPLTALRCE